MAQHHYPYRPQNKRQLLLNQPYIIDAKGSQYNLARNVIHSQRGLKRRRIKQCRDAATSQQLRSTKTNPNHKTRSPGYDPKSTLKNNQEGDTCI